MFNWISLGILAAIIATVSGWAYTYDARGKEITRLEHVVSEKSNQIEVLKESAKLNTGVVEALNKRLGERNADIADSCKLLDEIAKSKSPGDDDAVDPQGGILGQVLEKMRDPNAKVTPPPVVVKPVVPKAKDTVPPGKAKKDRKG